jgi:hypothetical protein
MPQEITIPAKTVYEEIQSITEFPDLKLVTVVTGIVGADGQFVVPQQFRVFQIQNEMYDELLSANPSWDTNKPAGTYFNQDLWHFIDMLR